MAKGLGLTAIPAEQQEAEQIAKEFVNYLNAFHVKNIQNDNDILKRLYQDYIDIFDKQESPNFKGVHHFRSSSTGACARQHYMRLKRKTPDKRTVLAQTTRWQNLGTRIGDMIQFDLLLGEKHDTGKFKFERKQIGSKWYPHFEEFSTVVKKIEHNGQTYFLHGSTDGIMEYVTADGRKLRVGLEIKSKQGSYSKTSLHSMKAPDYKHRKQTVSYSIMFDVDYWIILYVNASKKSWSPTEEDLIKTPDIRAFGHYVTPAMKQEVKDRFAWICESTDNNTPPPLELNNYTFNDYKQACAESLSQQEMLELLDYLESEEVMNYPAWLQKSMRNAMEDIAERKGL